jgi:Zn-finger nucleic acid-binding protein
VLEITIDNCYGCHGIWFDPDEIETYQAKLKLEGSVELISTGTFVADSNVNPAICPRCVFPTLYPGEYRGNKVLRCAGCRGIFVPSTAATTSVDEPGLESGSRIAECLVYVIGAFLE